MKRGSAFLAGFLTCALTFGMIGSAVAAYTRQETLHFNGIKLVLDGEQVQVTDSTGTPAEPFIINGTTYLPVANIARMLGLTVTWDGATQTITLTSPEAEAAKPAEPDPLLGEITMGQKNALAKADSYLKFMAFSYRGLVNQLEFEGFSHADAVFAADHCGADWNVQAARKAESYLTFMAFSRSGLIEQLEFEGFTHEQAVYGAQAVGY